MEGLCMFAEPFCLENDGLLHEDPNCNFAYYARSFIESIKSNIENDIKILHYCHGTHIAKILIISALKSLRERDILKSNLRDSILTGKKAYWNKMKVYLLYNEYAELEKAFVCNKSLIQYRADWETRIQNQNKRIFITIINWRIQSCFVAFFFALLIEKDSLIEFLVQNC